MVGAPRTRGCREHLHLLDDCRCDDVHVPFGARCGPLAARTDRPDEAGQLARNRCVRGPDRRLVVGGSGIDGHPPDDTSRVLLRCDALVAREADSRPSTGRCGGRGQAGPGLRGDGPRGRGQVRLDRSVPAEGTSGSGARRACAAGRVDAAAASYRAALAAIRAGADPDTDALRLYDLTLARLLHGRGRVDRRAASRAGCSHSLRVRRCCAWSAASAPPVVLLLEDLHWADAETLDTVEYLLDHAPAERVAVLATLRDDEPGPAHGMVARTASRHAARVIELGPPGRDHVAEMVAHCVGADASAQLVDEVIARTEGVPLLVEEWLSTAADMGRLRRQDGRWTLAPGHVPLPPPALRWPSQDASRP